MAITQGIVQLLLGVIFVITGSFKTFQGRQKIIASGGAWATDFAPGIIKAIAVAELLSGLSLIVSEVIASLRHFAFAGAAAIAIIMTGSLYVHLRRKEFSHAGINALFLLMALFVAYMSK